MKIELIAAAQALRPLPDRAQFVTHSDSEYLIYGKLNESFGEIKRHDASVSESEPARKEEGN